MVLEHVSTGDPHVAAHNDERDAINRNSLVTFDSGLRAVDPTSPKISNKFMLWRSGNLCGMQDSYFGTNDVSEDFDVGEIIYLLPEGFRPRQTVWGVWARGPAGPYQPTSAMMSVSASGVRVYNTTSQGTGYLRFSIPPWYTPDAIPSVLPGTQITAPR